MRFSSDEVVGGIRTLDGKTMRDQALEIEFALGEKLQKSIHIARLGPAHVADGVVDSLLLVSCIVTSWTIGTRYAELEFLFVKGSAWNLHSNRSHGDDDRSIACDCGGQVNRIIAASLRGDHDRVDSVTG